MEDIFRRKRILARHRQGKTLCVFVRARRGSSSAVLSVDSRGGGGQTVRPEEIPPSLVSWPHSSQGVLHGTERGVMLKDGNLE